MDRLYRSSGYPGSSHCNPARFKLANVTGWQRDVLPGYWQRTIALGRDPDGEGDVVATLIRRGEAAAVPHALAVIREDTDAARVLVCGHSAGGLIGSLWLGRLRRRDATARAGIGGGGSASNVLDLPGAAVLRWAVTSALIAAIARVSRTRVARAPGAGGYGASLHNSYHGEFDYNLQWKPLGGFPITDAKHDVFLSMPQPRQEAYRQLDTWLDHYLGAAEPIPSQNG